MNVADRAVERFELTELAADKAVSAARAALGADAAESDVLEWIRHEKACGRLGGDELEALGAAVREHERAVEVAEARRAERDRAIVHAIGAGARKSDAARVAGLTRARLEQIVKEM